jgi:hypothetical protein
MGNNLKHFSELGNQVTKTSNSLTKDLRKTTRDLIENSKNGFGKDTLSHQKPHKR